MVTAAHVTQNYYISMQPNPFLPPIPDSAVHFKSPDNQNKLEDEDTEEEFTRDHSVHNHHYASHAQGRLKSSMPPCKELRPVKALSSPSLELKHYMDPNWRYDKSRHERSDSDNNEHIEPSKSLFDH